jgi:hypothetical protein
MWILSLNERERLLAACPLCVGLEAAAFTYIGAAATTHNIVAQAYLFGQDGRSLSVALTRRLSPVAGCTNACKNASTTYTRERISVRKYHH